MGLNRLRAVSWPVFIVISSDRTAPSGRPSYVDPCELTSRLSAGKNSVVAGKWMKMFVYLTRNVKNEEKLLGEVNLIGSD